MLQETVSGVPLLTFEGLSRNGALHAFTTRAGGVSAGPFATLNLGFHAGDDPGAVVTNRLRVSQALGVPLDSWVCAQQVHGANVAVVWPTDRGRGSMAHADALPATDALITAARDIALAAFSADCPLVALVDPGVPAIGLAHASWRSTVARIVARTVGRMVQVFSCRPERMYAAISPSAGPCCYEVGPEVREAAEANLEGAERFFVQGSGARNQALAKKTNIQHPTFNIQRSITEDMNAGHRTPNAERRKTDSYAIRNPKSKIPNHFDLWSANVAQLVAAGVPRAGIEVAEVCTICHNDEFFSYRAQGSPVGHAAFLLALL